MTIAQLNECVSRMREIYPFKDEETEIDLTVDVRCSGKTQVFIRTYDKKYETNIALEGKITGGRNDRQE